MDAINFSKSIPVKKHYDVIVAGGGMAGCAAAISVVKRGKSVLLIEKSNILGGLGTLGLINLFVPMCNGRGKQIIFGLCEKWVRDSAKYGYDTIPEEWKNGEPKEPTKVRYLSEFSPYIFALQLLEEVTTEGVDLLLDCNATYPLMEGNHCKGVITDSKSALECYTCDELVDTTGDADLLRRSGMPTVPGKNYFTYAGKAINLAGCRRAVEKENIRYAYSSFCGGDINLYGDHQPADRPMWSGLSVEEVTDYLKTNQLYMLEKLKPHDRMSRDMAMLTMMPSFRTTCHIAGDYTFTVQDVYRHFDDSVCAINDFDHRDHLFEVPLRALTRRGYDNMITAGRSVCAEGYGWDVVRCIPQAIMTGQAAGEAVSLALDEKKAVSDVTITTLQSRLEEANVMVHFDDSLVPEKKTLVIHGKDLWGNAGANDDSNGHAEGHI